MIDKRNRYPDSKITESSKFTEHTEAKVKQDLFGKYIFDDGLEKQSFSKLIKDISQEIGL